MKQALKTTALLVAFAALSTTAFAQGRHDEKPHGMKKGSSSATEESRASGTGGRHDEGGTTHGKKKPAAKKKARAATDAAPAGK